MPGFSGDTANLIVALRLDDSNFSGRLARATSQVAGFGRGFSQMGRGVGQVAAGLGRVGFIAGTVAVGGFVAAAKAAGDFEAQLNTINTIVKLNDQQLKTLGEGIRETFRETGVPLEDLTAAYYDLLSAGIKVGDAQSVLNTAVKLGIGGLATTAESVDLLTTAINAYQLDASGAARASDIFAAAVRDGKVTVSELNASFADVAPLAATVGVKLEEIGAAYATLTARGVPAVEVGTQFNRAIIELLKPGPELVGIMEDLGLASFETSIKQKGLVATLQDVRDEAEKQGVPFQDLFGRLEAYKFALATTGPSMAKFNEELKAMHLAAGETAAQFSERQQGLNFQLSKLKALAQDAGITIGNALLPKLVPLVTKLNDFITKNQDKIAEFGQKLAAGFQTFADRVKDADFSGAIQTLKILGDVGKKVVDIFLSLPPQVQAAIITGAAINKLSGGLLGQGAGNIGGGVLKLVWDRFGARGSSPANPVWVASAVGGVGGGGAPGIVPFGLGDIIRTAFVVFAGAEAQKAGESFLGANNPFDPGNKLGPILDNPDQSIFDIWANGLNEQVEQALNLPGKGGHHPKGWTKGMTGAGKAARTLPDTAFDPGGGVVKLPNTAMNQWAEIARNTARLPSILTSGEQASRATARAVMDAKFSQMAGLGSIRDAVNRKDLSAKVDVDTKVVVNTNTYVSGSMVSKQQSVTHIAHGFRGGVPEGPG